MAESGSSGFQVSACPQIIFAALDTLSDEVASLSLCYEAVCLLLHAMVCTCNVCCRRSNPGSHASSVSALPLSSTPNSDRRSYFSSEPCNSSLVLPRTSAGDILVDCKNSHTSFSLPSRWLLSRDMPWPVGAISSYDTVRLKLQTALQLQPPREEVQVKPWHSQT